MPDMVTIFPLATGHQGHRFLHGNQGAGNGEIKGPGHIVFALTQQRPKGGGRSISDKYIQITERRLHLLKHRPHRLAVTQVSLNRQRLRTTLFDLVGNRFRFGPIPAVIHNNPCPFGRQPQGNRPAYASRRTGDKSHFVCKTHACIPFGLSLPWSAHR